MEPTSQTKIQLESAQLCLDLTCNAVFDGMQSHRCPACGGEEVYPLVVWLNRADRASLRGWHEPAARLAPPAVRAA
jgi:rRNA maturation endonuclease Nob1